MPVTVDVNTGDVDVDVDAETGIVSPYFHSHAGVDPKQNELSSKPRAQPVLCVECLERRAELNVGAGCHKLLFVWG